MIEMETKEFMTRSAHMPKPSWTMHISARARGWFSRPVPQFASQGFSNFLYLHAELKYHQQLYKKAIARERNQFYWHTEKSSGNWYQCALALLPVCEEEEKIFWWCVAPGSDLGQEVGVGRICVDDSITEEKGVSVSFMESGAPSRQIVQEIKDGFVYGRRSWGCSGNGGEKSYCKGEETHGHLISD